jgi:thioredoxin-like negative regulator of GroEL
VNVDQCEALADAYDVRSIPTTLFIPMQGHPIKMVGAISKREIERQIHEVLLKDQLHHAEV